MQETPEQIRENMKEKVRILKEEKEAERKVNKLSLIFKISLNFWIF